MVTRGNIIVIASRLSEVSVVTPRTPHAARGILGRRLVISSRLSDAQLEPLLGNVEPCFATTVQPPAYGRGGAARQALEFVEQTIYANEGNGNLVKWDNAEVLELLEIIRDTLR